MTGVLRRRTARLAATAAGLLAVALAADARAQTARLVPAPEIRMPGEVDSNSPSIWGLIEGRPVLHVLTSVDGQPSVASGPRLTRLGESSPVVLDPPPGHGVWMEAVVADDAGTWYGYYHNEVPADQCGRPDRVVPRIGAARSADGGRTWQNLGIVLEAPDDGLVCDSPNGYFVGGVGDLSVMLDHSGTTLYLFFSQYSRQASGQGVAVARLLWAARDAPVGRVEVWSEGAWLPPVARRDASGHTGWAFGAGTPLVAPDHPWHDEDPVNDAFWGASVHWNSYLEQHVMLLNRTKDEGFGQEGLYVSFSPALDDPSSWSPPVRLVSGGRWYPQVMGLEPGAGTDKQAGAQARFFIGGVSTHWIEFSRPH